MPSGNWFDAAQLLPGERLVRSESGRLRIKARPGWWAGRLVLTSDRLFFLPDAEHPEIGAIALWISSISHVSPLRRNRVLVSSLDTDLLFELRGSLLNPVGLMGRRGELWTNALASARNSARPGSALEGRRRAAG